MKLENIEKVRELIEQLEYYKDKLISISSLGDNLSVIIQDSDRIFELGYKHSEINAEILLKAESIIEAKIESIENQLKEL